MVLQGVDDAQHGAGPCGVGQRDGGGGQHGQVGAGDRDTGGVERVADAVEVGRSGGDLERVAQVGDVFGAGVERRDHEVVFGGCGLLDDDAAVPFDLPRHR